MNLAKASNSFRAIPAGMLSQIWIYALCQWWRQQQVIDGLIGWWRFDEGSGASAFDSSGNARTGTLENGAAWIPGLHGSAIQMTGQPGNNVNLGNSFPFEHTDPFSFALWVRDRSTYAVLVSKSYAFAPDTLLEMATQSHQLYLFLVSGGVRALIVRGGTTMFAGVWYHVAGTYDGSGAAAGIRLYINAVPEALTTVSDTLAGNSVLTPVPWRIGNMGTETPPFDSANADFDDVRIYNRVLLPDEVARIYNNGAGE